MSRPEGMEAAIAAIWERNKALVSARLDTIDAAADAVAAGVADPELVARGKGEAHTLAGSLGTFGYPEGSVLARELEQLFSRDDLAPADAARAPEAARGLRAALSL